MSYGDDVPEPTETELAGASEEHANIRDLEPAPVAHPFLAAMARLDLQEDIDSLLADLLRGQNPESSYLRLCRHYRGDWS